MKRIWQTMLKGTSRELNELAAARVSEGQRPADRRSERRYSTDAPGIVTASPKDDWVPCRVLDVSRSGMRIRSDKAFPLSCEVYIMLSGGSIVVGQVRYSRRVEQEWDTGLRIISHSLEIDGAVRKNLT